MRTLLQMTLTGGALIATLALLRLICFDRVSKGVFRWLWLLPVARLLIPWTPAFSLSALSLLSRQQPLAQAAPATQAAQAILGTAGGSVPGDTAPAEGQVLGETGADLPIWLLIWLGVALGLGVWFFVSWLVCRRRFASSLPFWWPDQTQWLAQHPLRRTLRIRQSDRVEVPLTYGILHPVILVPSRVAPGSALDYVLEHEFVHIRRWDGLYKLLLTAVLCLHWCNPLVWLMVWLANRDVELACDQTVVRHFGPEIRADYARTLLRFEAGGGFFCPYPSQFGHSALKGRIAALGRHKKGSLLLSGAVVLVALCAVLFWATAARPQTLRQLEVEGYTYLSLEDLARSLGCRLDQKILDFSDGPISLDDGTLWVPPEAYAQARGVAVSLSSSKLGELGSAELLFNDGQITDQWYDGCLSVSSETLYPSAFYLSGEELYIAGDLGSQVSSLISSLEAQAEPVPRLVVEGYTYVALRETAKHYGYTLKQTIEPYEEIQESGALVQGQSVTCYLSQPGSGPTGDAWFVWQDGQITSYMYGGCMYGATETSYPTPFYLEGRRVYVAEDLVDTIFSPETDPGP